MGHNATATWAADPADLLRAGPGFDLAALNPGATPGWLAGKDAAKDLLRARGELLSELQERLWAHGRTGGRRAVLLVVQGLDTSGKGGIIRHVAGFMDPQGLAIRSFGVPTAEERSHHYLWRIRSALPAAGRVGVFDRSHYEDVLVVRVEGLAQADWPARHEEINEFERGIVDSGTVVVKVALMISRREQGRRLMERLERPDKHWKFNPGDVDTRRRWDDYQAAYADVLAHTSTDWAPWYVIPADEKWYSRLAVSELLAQALVSLDLAWPPVPWEVETQKRRLAATMPPEEVARAAAQGREARAEAREDDAAVQARMADVEQIAGLDP